jgi:hypothetical protein
VRVYVIDLDPENISVQAIRPPAGGRVDENEVLEKGILNLNLGLVGGAVPTF